MESDELLMLEVIRRFRQLHHQMSTRLYLLSHSETAVLQGIRQMGARANVSDIARAMLASPPSISRTLRQLREKEYVDSRPDENDRRNTYVVLTPKGRAVLTKDMEQRQRFHAAVIQRMGQEQWDTLCKLMDSLYDCMRLELEEWPDEKPARKD